MITMVLLFVIIIIEGDFSFYKSSVSDVTLESGLTIIVPNMFSLTVLLAIMIPSTVTSIGLFDP